MLGFYFGQVSPQWRGNVHRQHRHAIFRSFAIAHGDLSQRKIDVFLAREIPTQPRFEVTFAPRSL